MNQNWDHQQQTQKKTPLSLSCRYRVDIRNLAEHTCGMHHSLKKKLKSAGEVRHQIRISRPLHSARTTIQDYLCCHRWTNVYRSVMYTMLILLSEVLASLSQIWRLVTKTSLKRQLKKKQNMWIVFWQQQNLKENQVCQSVQRPRAQHPDTG